MTRLAAAAAVAALLVATLVLVGSAPATSAEREPAEGRMPESASDPGAEVWVARPDPDAAPSARQIPASQQEAAVLEVIHGLFEAMKAKDTETIAELFHPEARLLSTSVQGGETVVQAVAIPDFVASVGSSPSDLEERIWDEEVRVDGPLATAWTPYAFFVDGDFSHCGVNSFQLARTAEGWRILHVVDTRRTDACPEGAPR